MRRFNSYLFSGILSFLLVPMLCVGMLIQGLAYADERSVTIKPKEKRDLSVEAKKGLDTALLNTKYYAIIIGNNNYKFIKKLNTAIADANAVDKILRERFGFKTKVLIDATRKEILDTINDYRKKLGRDDNLLIYYAGHGELDKTADKSYWLPVDAQSDSPTEWIMADDLTSNIKRIISKHILIVSDSCYSGTLTRAVSGDLSKSGEERDEFIKKMMERPSRTLMASGGNEPVSDSGGGNNSVFAAAFLKALNEADKPLLTAEELFHDRVKEIVAGKSDQVPEYNKIRNSGDEGGDFVFRLAKAYIPSSLMGEGEGGVALPSPPPLPPAAVVLQGHLQVNVNAPSARVYVNGEDKGTASPGSPLNMENLPTGTASIRVEAEGYESLQKTVTIQRNQWIQEVFELKRIQVASLPPPPIDQPKSRLAEKDNMVMIPAGEFMAGEPWSLKGMVLSAFYIDKYKVTQREFQQVMRNNPSRFKGCDDCPVESVTWDEAKGYCEKVGKRLPTEWEWEKAAKAETTTTYYWGESEGMAGDYAWYKDNSGDKTHPVGQKKPNGYGLYDMAGNVWEWTSTDYDMVYDNTSQKVLRSGSWGIVPVGLRSSYRSESGPTWRHVNIGFRCVQ